LSLPSTLLSVPYIEIWSIKDYVFRAFPPAKIVRSSRHILPAPLALEQEAMRRMSMSYFLARSLALPSSEGNSEM
jgi:hypothetical protein